MKNRLVNNHFTLAHFGAASSIGMALCYIGLFIIYGALLSFPSVDVINEKIIYLVEHKMLVKSAYIGGYILFGCFLVISVQTIHALFKKVSKNLINTASIFGLFWALAVLCTGMIGITSLELLSTTYNTQQPASEITYYTSLLMELSLGGGIELLGGLWVFLLGISGWRHNLFSKTFAVFSILKGVIGISTVFSNLEVLRELFGLTGIVWFVWLSVILLKNQAQGTTD